MAQRIIVVGGVAGGASFAARMRRLNESAEITIFDKGKFVSFANCGLPYHIGETIKERDKLIVQTPDGFKNRFNIDVRLESEITAINAAEKTVTVKAGDSEYIESYDKLLLSPGASPLRPPIPGINSDKIHTLRTIPDMDKIKEKVDDGSVQRAVVIGGGFIGLEMAENLRHRGIEVTLVELSDQVFIPADWEMANILHQHIALNGVNLILEDGAKEFKESAQSIDVILNSGKEISADMVVLAIGVRPDTGFIRESGIELTERGAIKVNDSMQTNFDDIYAVGDAIEVTDFVTGAKVMVPLAGPANRQGRIAADHMMGKESTYKATQGTAVCKIFDLTAAVTGLNEKNAKRSGVSYLKTYTHSVNHAGYYPDAYQMSLKILFDEKSGKLLGAQAIGKEGVDKRIDVFATALRSGLTIYDLTELELAYAPPYGSAKDPVNMIGFVAQNVLEGRNPQIFTEDLIDFDPEKQMLVDVRQPEELEMGTIDGSVNIPLDSLRDSLDQFDKEKEIILFCQIGLRGYLAASILMEHGFTVRNLAGGYKTYGHKMTKDYDAQYLQPTTSASCSSAEVDTTRVHKKISVDACGLQCPGPIMKLKEGVDGLKFGESLEIMATDQGFAMDVPAWCSRTGNTLVSLNHEGGKFSAVVSKGASKEVCTLPDGNKDKKTMVVFSNDFDRAMATFIIANGAASMGSEVVLFFTFWGLNLLRKADNTKVEKSFMEKMFGMMMPKGADKTQLSKMNMMGMGKIFMEQEMKKKNVMSLQELIAQAKKNKIRLVACTMSMDIMGIKKEELIDGVEYGGVAAYLNEADQAKYNLFI